MKDALVTMCKRIDSFTENPTFKMLDVVDAAQSAKAGRDLRDIILLSGGHCEVAQKLRSEARIRGQKSEVRSQRSEVRSQKSEVDCYALYNAGLVLDEALLISDL